MLATNALFRVVFFFDRHSIVDSVGGDQDRAVDALLAMGDPDHVTVNEHVQPPQVRHAIILLALLFPSTSVIN